MTAFSIALNTYREAVRNKILYSAVLFAVVLVGVSAIFGSVSIGSQQKVIKDFGLFSLSFFGAIMTIISGVSLLNRELKQKTIYNILSKPVPRWQFIVGKHIGLSLTVAVLVSLMGLSLVVFAACFEGQVDWLLFQAIGFILMEMVVISSIAIFFSSLVVTTTLTGLFTFGTYLAGRSIAYLSYFTSQTSDHTVLSKTIEVLNWIIPDLNVFNINDLVVYGIPATQQQFLLALCYCVCYSVAAIILAAVIFSRRELN